MKKVTTEQQKAFKQKQTEMIYKGLKNHKVFTYPQQLFDRLRPFSFGGFPVSIMQRLTHWYSTRPWQQTMVCPIFMKL